MQLLLERDDLAAFSKFIAREQRRKGAPILTAIITGTVGAPLLYGLWSGELTGVVLGFVFGVVFGGAFVWSATSAVAVIQEKLWRQYLRRFSRGDWTVTIAPRGLSVRSPFFEADYRW